MTAHAESDCVPVGEAGVWRKCPALRLLVYSAVTVTAGWPALFVFMPPGFVPFGVVVSLSEWRAVLDGYYGDDQQAAPVVESPCVAGAEAEEWNCDVSA